MSKAYKGKFSKLKNPSKYQGDISKIVWRSSWEREAFVWCDENPNISEWASEELFIPYYNPVLDRKAKYYPDLYIKMKDGTIRLIEIKPKKQTVKPETPKRKTKNYLNEVTTFMVNMAKWEAATEIAHKNNMTFEIWTEDELRAMGLLKATNNKALLAERRVATASKRPPRTRINKPRPKRKS